jgi:hypothetical protein
MRSIERMKTRTRILPSSSLFPAHRRPNAAYYHTSSRSTISTSVRQSSSRIFSLVSDVTIIKVNSLSKVFFYRYGSESKLVVKNECVKGLHSHIRKLSAVCQR